jgi:RNA polymerase sigma-70 factor, ECF subfamily
MGSRNRHATTTTTTTTLHGAAASEPGRPQPLPIPPGGDNTAFAEAYRTHLAALSAQVAARLTDGDLDVVADLVHDAFADALADPTLIGADVLASLRRLCDRACTRYLWSQRRYLRAVHTVYADQRADQPPAPPTAQPGTVEALAALPDAERQVACLRFLDGHTPQVTAWLLGRSVGHITYLERRACHLLREHLTPPAAAPAATAAPASLTGRA